MKTVCWATIVCVIQFFVFVSLPSNLTGDEIRHSSTLPDSLTAEEFSELIHELSEPDGPFHSDNYVSNETSYLHPVGTLRKLGISKGVYLGVGPEQNFTYIAETKPEMAFIIDIRRQNLLQHILYKALFELAESRLEFLSLLFSKPLHENFTESNQNAPNALANRRPGNELSIAGIVEYFDTQNPDTTSYVQNLQSIKALTIKYGISAKEDLDVIEAIYNQFFRRQFEIKYDIQAPPGFPIPDYPDLRDLLLSTTLDGETAIFLAREDSFRYVKDLHIKNLIVPVVGDFAGDKALRGILEFVRKHNSVVSVFYTSNVELYLSTRYPSRKFLNYFETVFSMPTDQTSYFIRTYANDLYQNLMDHPDRFNDHLFTTVIQPVDHLSNDRSWLSLTGYNRYIHLVTTGNLELD